MVRGRPVGADRRQQLLRAGCGGRDRLFGFQSGAALATVVGVLIEVPVMLSVVHIVRRSRGWYESGAIRGMTLTARAASPADAHAIAAIYNEGIADRIGTFETEPRSTEQIAAWFDGRHPIVVVEDGREVVAFASTSAYRARPCYAGIAEFSVYVARNRRSAGAAGSR